MSLNEETGEGLSDIEEFFKTVDWESRSLRTIPDWFLRQVIVETEKQTVLNIAAGDGLLQKQLNAEQVVSCDISKDRFNSITNPVQADAQELPFNNESFDSIISIETIEHLQQPQHFIDEMYRVLRPSGHVYLKTPNRILHDLFQLAGGRYRESKEWHPSVFTPRQLKTCFSQYSNVQLYDTNLMEYQMEKIKNVNIGIGGVFNTVPFTHLPKIFQPSIVAIAEK